MTEQTHVLVVDDEAEIRDLVSDYLAEEGFRVTAVGDGEAMRRSLDADPAQIVILDIRLPKEDGFSLASELRRSSDAGIIMLSEKKDIVDRVAGLEVGADDYLSKPFHLRELLARVRSVLRRRESGPEAAAAENQPVQGRSILTFAGWKLDMHSRTLLSPDHEAIDLSGGEFDLLVAFLEHPKHVLSRDRLLDLARSREADLFDRSIDVQVGRLRRKIEADPRRPALIKTVRGAGYMLAVDVKRAPS